jgi:CRISPR subtype II RNA-guided endonuclease Cas9/Csn1
MQSKQNFGSLTFGFDIGIASVGWAVVGEKDGEPYMRLGVRAFDPAEDSDKKPNNQTRRGARVSRNRFQMRAWRLQKLRELFLHSELLTQAQIDNTFSDSNAKNEEVLDVWQLRAEAIKGKDRQERKLESTELARVIYTIIKNRGVKFFSKKEDPRALQNSNDPTKITDNADSSENAPLKLAGSEEDKQREGIKSGLNKVAELRAKYPQYRTDAEMAYYLNKEGKEVFAKAIRNVDKDYKCVFHRDDLLKELELILNTQATYYPFISKEHDSAFSIFPNNLVQIGPETKKIEHTFFAHVCALMQIQHPPIYANQMDMLIGDCELEDEYKNGVGKAEKRASKHAFSNERATWLQMLNNLRINIDGRDRALSEQERVAILNIPYTQSKVTFAQVREVLNKETGFPISWREARFNKVSYRSKRKNLNQTVRIIKADGIPIELGKYIADKNINKQANKTLKLKLEAKNITFSELREIFQVATNDVFEVTHKSQETVVPHLETEYSFDYVELETKVKFVKVIEGANSAKTLNKQAQQALKNMGESGVINLADLRIAINQRNAYQGKWYFEIGSNKTEAISLLDEPTRTVPIAYEDAQDNEKATFVELKGWHALRQALEEKHPDFWASLQMAWREPTSAEGLGKAKLLDDIAETLTKMQTDNEVEEALAGVGMPTEVVSSLQLVDFKGYKNLSLKALRNILPNLEKGESYSSACSIAGYDKFKKIAPQKFLPELTTYTYERYKHGKKTSYTEKRFKEVNNPVVARAFCQARLVLNALIAEHKQSPDYVHIELARDVGKSKKQRDEIDSRQKENRARREIRRSDFKQDKGYEPSGELDLKLQLLDEQMQQCAYTLKELKRDLVISDPFYAEIDHIWPRSKTFDNSTANKVLVLAHANQNKGNRIPYDYIRNDARFGVTQEAREMHWRRVEKHTLTCHDMDAKKRERITAKALDSDEFTARNLVDTRYATRLFANWVRARLLFAGQIKDEVVDIDSAESGKSRLEKYHKTRVRTPQGRVVAFLRGRWLGDKIKDREASDKHHAIDALITASCSPALIKRVNDWFANEENYPNRFVRNKDGTYTDRSTGDKISKQQAREQGLFLPAPWDEKDNNTGQIFRKLFEAEYEKVFVSRMLREKKNLKLHDANPMAWKRQNKMKRVRLYNLKIQQLDLENEKLYAPASAEKYLLRNKALITTLLSQLEKYKDAREAFKDVFEFRGQKIRTIKLPEQIAKRNSKDFDENGFNSLTQPTAHKTVKLIDLTPEQLTVEKLGEQFFSRNDKLIQALVEQLKKHGGNSEKAFPNSEFYPFGEHKKDKFGDYIKDEKGNLVSLPLIRSLRLPLNKNQGLFVRGGLADIGGTTLRTDVYWENGRYEFKPVYKVTEEKTLNKSRGLEMKNRILSLTQDDLLEVVLADGAKIFGYFVMYEGDGRMKIREHDKKKKDASRFSVSSIKLLTKFESSILGDLKVIEATIKHGLA